MYEPIRTKPLRAHAPSAKATAAPPRPSRAEHLNTQLAGHLAALLMVTEELRSGSEEPEADLDEAAGQITERITALSPGGEPALIWEGNQPRGGRPDRAALHRRAHTLAGRVLVVAASRQDTTTAMLACLRMEAHERAVKAAPLPA